MHHRGIEIDKNKAREITEALPIKNKKELQRLIGYLPFYRRFLSNLAGKLQPLSPCCETKGLRRVRVGGSALESVR